MTPALVATVLAAAGAIAGAIVLHGVAVGKAYDLSIVGESLLTIAGFLAALAIIEALRSRPRE